MAARGPAGLLLEGLIPGVEGTEQRPKQLDHLCLLWCREHGEDPLLARDQVGEGGVDAGASGRREHDPDATTILGVRLTSDQAARLEPVDAVGHRAAGHQGLRPELAGGERVGRAGSAQCRQDVELPGLQCVSGEGLASGGVQVLGQASHPGEHLEGSDVEVGALALPCSDQSIDLIRHDVMLGETLDVKIHR